MKYIIDRFEGDLAVLEDETGVTTTVSKVQLPADVKEGDIVTTAGNRFRFDETATKETAARIKGKMSALWK